MPYASEKETWTEEQLTLYDYVELALGNREELTPEEMETRKAASKVEEELLAGGDWLSILEEEFGSGTDIDDIDVDEEMVRMIESEFGDGPY